MDRKENNGVEKKNFCMFCGKYTEEELQPLRVGVIDHQLLLVNGCPRCEVVLQNADRMFTEALKKIRQKVEETEEKRIIIPGMTIPKDVLKKS